MVRINTKNLLIFFFATLIYALCQMLFSNMIMGKRLWDDFFYQLSIHYSVIFTMSLTDYILLLFLNKYIPYSKNVLIRIAADFIGVTIICLILLSIFNYLIYNIFLIPKEGLPPFTIKFAFGMITNIPILLIYELIYYLQSEQKAKTDSEKAKREALLFQHETLRAQLNPHFLFNSLNVLSSLIYIHPDKANTFTKSLSKTYRYILSLNQQALVSVVEELDMLESYMYMMKMRFDNAFTFQLDKGTGYENQKIIPLTLQLLIENAFKHNVAIETKPLEIEITIGNKYIIVSNNIQITNNEVDKGGIGLKYLQEQYKSYRKEVIVAHSNEKFTVKIPYIET